MPKLRKFGYIPESCVVEEDWQMQVRNSRTRVRGPDLPEGALSSFNANGAVCNLAYRTDPCEDYEIKVACLGECSS